MISTLPLAWRIMTHSRRRLALALCGIAFSVLIMFLEMGFYNGLMDSQAMLPSLLNADLVMLHVKRTSLLESHRFPPLRLSMIQAYDDVAEAVPFYEGFTTLRNPQTRQVRKIYALAFLPGTRALRLPGLESYEERLTQPGTVLYDRRSRYIFGRVEAGMSLDLEGDRPHRVVGLVALGPNFGYDGYLLMSGSTWKGLGNGDGVSLGLIRVRPGTDVDRLAARLKAELPEDVTVMTPAALRAREVAFTRSATPSGVLLATGLIIGLIIGVTICYQILFNTIYDHLPQYAALKAVGFTDGFLMGVVMHKALLLSLLGYLPGLLLSLALYAAIEARTSIIMDLTPGRMLTILPLTVFMCALAGLFALRIVIKADPAELC
jgi:putative ABC transport system permease protein